jgi:hypothetical protein
MADKQENLEELINKMSAEHIQFCEAYLSGFTGKNRVNATEAYCLVYPDSERVSASSSSFKLLKRDDVKAYIAKRLGEMAMSTNEVLLRLADLSRNADKDSDKIRAMELIGKHQAMWLDRTDVTSAGSTISLADFILAQAAAKKENKTGITVLGE